MICRPHFLVPLADLAFVRRIHRHSSALTDFRLQISCEILLFRAAADVRLYHLSDLQWTPGPFRATLYSAKASRGFHPFFTYVSYNTLDSRMSQRTNLFGGFSRY